MTTYNKIFIQAGSTGNNTGWGQLVTQCTQAGIPIFAAASDGMTLLYDLQVARQTSGVPHTGNFIPTEDANGRRFDFDYAIYPDANHAQTAYQANAIVRWNRAEEKIPPELDKDIIAISLENEQRPYIGWGPSTNPDDPAWQQQIPGFTGWADAIGWQAYHTGQEAIRRGYKYMAFGFAGGNPEEGAWQQPGMIAYLQLCAQHPDRLGIALHEYSFTLNLQDDWGYNIGRFQQLHATCDAHNIPRPLIQIKEFGWQERHIPDTTIAMQQLPQASALYSQHPNIQGAAIWTTATGWDPASQQVPQLIAPLKDYTLNWRYDGPIEPPPTEPPQPGETLIIDENYVVHKGDWYDKNSIQQVRHGWTAVTKSGDNTLGGGQWHMPEAIFRWRDHIPQNEWPVLLNQYGHAKKVFASHKAWWHKEFKDEPLPPGRYRVELTYYDDNFVDYQNGQKIPPPDPLSFEARVFIGPNGPAWTLSQFQSDNTLTAVIETTDERVVGWEARGRWGLAHVGIFVKHFRVWELDDTTPPPTEPTPPAKIRHQIHLLPQNTNLPELTAVTQHLHPTRSAFAYSADVAHAVLYAGTEESTIHIWDGDRWPGNIWQWFANRGFTNTQNHSFSDIMPGDNETIQLPIANPHSQRDSRWANVTLGQDTGHGKTIGNWGCLLVAYTMQAQMMGVSLLTPPQMNAHMVAQGAFHAQYIQPAALRTAYPNDVLYLGYKTRNDSTMIPTIVERIDNAIPVPARVDFHPETPQWEQHWVLIIGYVREAGQITDFIMADPWTGQISPVSDVYSINGTDILEAIFYDTNDTPQPPPTTGNARIGLHASADPGFFYGGTPEHQEFKTLLQPRAGMAKVLSAHAPESIERLYHDIHPDTFWAVRAFLDFGGREISPQKFFDDTYPDTNRTIELLRALGVPDKNIALELHNEPNLAQEGWGRNWADGYGFASWGVAVASLYNSALPGIKLMYPGLSPGGDVPNLRYDATKFRQESQTLIGRLDALGVHAYWSNNYPMSGALSWVNDHLQYGKPIYITEASNNERQFPPPTSVYIQDYYDFWQALRQRPLIQGVTYFVASASNPEYHPEAWVLNGQSKGFAEGINNLINQS